ncbi:2Fe-2S iron-sulfur cluster-binding protein [Sphingopyxis sp.]|jgi:2Fe-2S ferredoxin|uniref:2Fe-2S iron-sulfur cluster-binding protein n=1 Tax=Sphingopyxis sp. TaxID=1908224 RepID=UPI00311F73A2
MTRVNFIQHDGTLHQIDTEDGYSLMEVAINNNISGIDGDCGGVCACATCHVYVDDAWRAMLGERTETETDMLELAADVTERSRLACQIKIEAALEGLTVHLPESQH